MNQKIVLTTPISASDIENLHVGDIVYLTGTLVTCRDVAHRRLVDYGKPLPIDLKDKAIFHAGPIIREKEDGSYEMVSIGPTTSMRMERFEKEFVEQTGVRLIVGKGGMAKNTEEACQRYKAVHAVFPAGCGVLAASKVEEITEAHWKELGMPETLWVCQVKEFGPLIISIDTKGNNIFEQNKILFEEKKNQALQEIYPNLSFIK